MGTYSDHEHKSCTLHNTPCCNVCCHHEGECDYGSCHEPATQLVDCYAYGKLAERRAACSRHARNLPNGVGYVLN